VLVVRRQSADGSAFRDFNVCRDKITQALSWLKINNRYYADIVIDSEMLKLLPDNGPIDDYLLQVQRNDDNSNDDDNETENMVTRNFVPVVPSSNREDDAINEAIARMQAKTTPIEWPNINGTSVNEFRTPGYITRAFPTLYPYGNADLHAERIRDVKPAEYFQHLLKYKDGRFARHTRWRYFALNSQMRWKVLQEAKVYVKQSLDGEQLTVEEVREMIKRNSHLADQVIRFGEGLHGTRQFWIRRRLELTDMIKQLGSKGIIFFTFSAADLHWPELHKLMPHGKNQIKGKSE
jgi:hypothetical protein